MVSRSISHYRVLRKLGEGGMGEVYLAEDTRLARQVALKVLPPHVAADEDRVRRFVLEAKAASALNHPNILTVYDIGDSENSRFIATELVNGETLRSRLRRAPFSLRESVDVAMQVASALTAAHGAGIIHRDIKPENIMVRPDGLVKVLDFGLAKLLAPIRGAADSEAETLAKGMTRPGSILGTLQYMSPEQVRGQSLDARSDLFSLGAVLYEMLNGKGLFDKPTQSDVIAAILMEAPILSDLPPQLQSIVAKSLQKDKAKRYQTSQELLLDLKRLNRELELSDQPVAVSPQTGEVAAFATSIMTARRFSLRQTLAILLLACLALIAVWWFAVRRPATTPAPLKITEVATWRSAPGEGYSVGSLSPDGSRVAFVTNIGGARNISVKQTAVNDSRVQTIKDGPYTDQPIWSPDGQEIAYFSTRGNQHGLWRVAYLGGSPSLIQSVPAADTKPRYWSKSGELYYEAKQNLFALNVKLGQTSQLTSFDSASTSAYSLNISPDEKQIVYIAVEGEQWGVWTMPARGGAARQVVNSAAEIRNAVWHSDSRRILYSALVDGVFQIFVTDTDASQPAQITFGDSDCFVLDVATDGAKILYGSSKEESDVWSVSITGEETALTSDLNSELWPSIAPDCKTVAYLSVKNLSQGDKLASGAILLKPTYSDASPTQLAADAFMPTWSPDGKQVAFMREADGVYNIWAIQAVGGEARQLTNGGVLAVPLSVMPYNRTQTSDFGWSPDGRRIVYRSKKSGAPNLWLVSADGANDTQVTDNRDSNLRYYSPLWSSDGKRLAYTSKPDNAVDGKTINRVWVVDVETRTAQTVFQSENFLRLLGWSEDGKRLIFATLNAKPSAASLPDISIAETSVAPGESHTLAKLQSAYLYNIHLSADGRMIAYVGQPDGKDNLYTMPTGGGAPKKLTANTDARLYFSSLAWSPDGKAIYFGKQWRHSLLSMISNFK
ncbi:MAG TPA: protein kinase [Blastocatellia bacterium]|nr:protein kinase [Blastocatellia bacterium]